MSDAVLSTRPAHGGAVSGDGPAIPLGASDEGGLVNDAQSVQASPGEVVEPGRALALADFAPPSVGAGERLLRLAYRLGIPGSALASPFRKPAKPRLLATVTNPLPGSKMAGTALRAGHFLVHGAKSPIAQIDFAGSARLSPPLERVVHSFAWLTDLEASAPRETVAPVAERIIGAWLNANPKPPARPGKAPARTAPPAAAINARRFRKTAFGVTSDHFGCFRSRKRITLSYTSLAIDSAPTPAILSQSLEIRAALALCPARFCRQTVPIRAPGQPARC